MEATVEDQMIEDLRATADGCSLVVTPGPSASGLADMLVSLGETGIGVSRAEPDPEVPGAYILTISGDMELAMSALTSAGCTIERALRNLAFV